MPTPASPEYLLISASLRTASLSRIMAEAWWSIREAGVSHRLIDLREFVLRFVMRRPPTDIPT